VVDLCAIACCARFTVQLPGFLGFARNDETGTPPNIGCQLLQNPRFIPAGSAGNRQLRWGGFAPEPPASSTLPIL